MTCYLGKYGLENVVENQPITLEVFLDMHTELMKESDETKDYKTRWETLPGWMKSLPGLWFTMIDRNGRLHS